jgi:hypothetical protein
MAFGFIILIALAVVSGYHSMHLPDGISKSIWVFRHDPSTDSFGACVGQLHASGIVSRDIHDYMRMLIRNASVDLC